MNINRTKKTITGSFFGIIEKILSIILPFIVRTILIKYLGSEYLGLNSLFTSILQVLSLTELGFGSAIIFCMYKPIANNDYKTVSGLIFYLKKIYRVIGIFMGTCGLIILPFIPNMISGTIPKDINVFIIYLIYLLNTILSYLLFAYKSVIFSATQENDILSFVGGLTRFFMYMVQILVLVTIKNYYIYLFFMPFTTLINNIIISYLVDKKYPQFLQKDSISNEYKILLKSKIVPLIGTKIAGVLLNSADTIVISIFLGLKDVAIYNNYYYIITSVMGLLIVIYNSMQAGIGNALVKDSREQIINTFNKLCFINMWIVTLCSALLLTLFQPFIKIWLGSEMMLSNGMVVLFVIYFYANCIQRIVVIYKDAAGIWREDMVRCYLSCFLNIIVNISTVRYIGLYGVIGSTIIANIIGLPLMALILYKTVFKISAKGFYINEIKQLFLSIIVCISCYYVTSFIEDNLIGFLIKGFITTVVSNAILYLLYRNSSEFNIVISWMKSSLERGLNKND